MCSIFYTKCEYNAHYNTSALHYIISTLYVYCWILYITHCIWMSAILSIFLRGKIWWYFYHPAFKNGNYMALSIIKWVWLLRLSRHINNEHHEQICAVSHFSYVRCATYNWDYYHIDAHCQLLTKWGSLKGTTIRPKNNSPIMLIYCMHFIIIHHQNIDEVNVSFTALCLKVLNIKRPTL